MMTAFLLDAFAHSSQSLVGFFFGIGDIGSARRVARVACSWDPTTGLAITVAQPLYALFFVTDGIHWGTGAFAFLRNAMSVSTLIGWACCMLIEIASPHALTLVWSATALWIATRATFGLCGNGRAYPAVRCDLATRQPDSNLVTLNDTLSPASDLPPGRTCVHSSPCHRHARGDTAPSSSLE